MNQNQFIAHIRKKDLGEQTLEEHLLNVGELARSYAAKIGLGDLGELAGILHDLGKYSSSFQAYIRSVVGQTDQDADDVGMTDTAKKNPLRGKIDHSTAGAQFIWGALQQDQNGFWHTLLGQLLALILVSHHSGLIDCIAPSGIGNFARRMSKDDELTHLSEVKPKISGRVRQRISSLTSDTEAMLKSLRQMVEEMKRLEEEHPEGKKERFMFKIGLLARFLFSCLLDADRVDTADFEFEVAASQRQHGEYVSWSFLVERLEEHLSRYRGEDTVSQERRKVSEFCRKAADRDKDIFTLTVPTGGGKTLASLLFALKHAEKHALDRIFYIVPYTSIIDQNEAVVRNILERHPSETGKFVLACHSNLSPEQATWQAKILSENWDAPIVFTTAVQFLEALFGGGTKSTRRMHQLANSLLIFDEVQTLPIRVVHMFCNALNFLIERCGSSAVLCTATQPLLNRVAAKRGALHCSERNEIVPDVSALFQSFRRTSFFDLCRPGGYSNDEIAALALEEQKKAGTVLVVVNTTKVAKEVFQTVKRDCPSSVRVCHLSAKMCPAHRTKVLDEVQGNLSQKPQIPVICISTQVIEAGVDVDFGCVIRSLAGLDSCAQAGGRVNRHGLRASGNVLLVNANEERLDKLTEIKEGRDVTLRVLNEWKNSLQSAGWALTPEMMNRYYELYFYMRAEEMSYPVNSERRDTLLEMLSTNEKAVHDHGKMNQAVRLDVLLKQSFASASNLFHSIEAPTQSVVVPYGEGVEIINGLLSASHFSESAALIRKAQRYSVNIYPHEFQSLAEYRGALYEAQLDRGGGAALGIWILASEFYSEEFGLSVEPIQRTEKEVAKYVVQPDPQ